MEVNPVGLIEGVTATEEEARPGGALGKDEFLQLLMTQMQNQDPLDPMNSQDTIAQLAQFSSLEQMKNLNDEMGAMRHESGVMQSMLLKGRNVLAQTGGGEEISGVVEKVTWGDEGIMLTIGEEQYNLKDLVSLSIIEPVTEEEAAAAAEAAAVVTETTVPAA